MDKNIWWFAASLSALAGFVDAVGFLHLGGYFISFMSGNSTRLAVQLAHANFGDAAVLAGIIALFVLGAVAGTLVRHKSRRPVARVLAFVALLLGMAAGASGIGMDAVAVVFMALAMGAENAVFQRNGETVVGLTYMTGTLVKLGQKLADALLGGSKMAWLPYLVLWSGLVCGGVVGALLFAAVGLASLWAAAGWAALLMVGALWRGQHLTG